MLKGVRVQTRRACNRPGMRSGVLVDGEPVTVFANRRQARRAIDRSEAAARALADPVCKVKFRDSPVFASLFNPEPWSVVPVEILVNDGTAADDPPDTAQENTAKPKAVNTAFRRVPQPELFAAS